MTSGTSSQMPMTNMSGAVSLNDDFAGNYDPRHCVLQKSGGTRKLTLCTSSTAAAIPAAIDFLFYLSGALLRCNLKENH